jgi:hypothetical protein
MFTQQCEEFKYIPIYGNLVIKLKNTGKTSGISVVLGFLLVSTLMLSQNAYAEELSDDTKLKLAFSFEQITGHISNAVQNIDSKNYEVGKLHLASPITEMYDDLDLQHTSYPKFDKKLELVLILLKNINPQTDKQTFVDIMDLTSSFISEGESLLITPESLDDPNFKLNLISKLLVSAQTEYHKGVSEINYDSIVCLENSYSSILRANSLFLDIDDLDSQYTTSISNQFTDLLFAMDNGLPVEMFDILMDELIHDVDDMHSIVVLNSV